MMVVWQVMMTELVPPLTVKHQHWLKRGKFQSVESKEDFKVFKQKYPSLVLLTTEHLRLELYKATVDILSRPVAIGCILAYAALSNLLSGVTTFGSTYIQKQFNVIRITSDMLIGGNYIDNIIN